MMQRNRTPGPHGRTIGADGSRREYDRRRQLHKRYGITLEAYDTMLSSQGGGCALCGATSPGPVAFFHVDHNHSTGAVRGLLCHLCNLGIGCLQDDPRLIERAARYVRG